MKRNGPANPDAVTWRGRRLTFNEWEQEPECKAIGLLSATIRYRLRKLKWTTERTMTTPPIQRTRAEKEKPRAEREPFPPPVPVEQRRAECVAGIMGRMREAGRQVCSEADLLAAWDDGHGSGARP